MRSRIIGGFTFCTIFYLAIVAGILFQLLLCIYLLIGLFEVLRMIEPSKNKLIPLVYALFFFICIHTLSSMQENYVGTIVYLTALIMMNDSLAFAFGMKYGKTKFSKVSPKKSVEGLIGGLIFAPFSAVLILEFVKLLNLPQILIFNAPLVDNYWPFGNFIHLYIFSIIICVFAVLGDLFESYLKRNANTKDSGSIVFGHGGILDRLDSWVFAIPIAYLLITYIF
ncbi:MAG: phosphatidate cytidylyltransferase [Mycoplasmatales bacterium]